MDRKDMDFARIWARRYISEHHPHGLDASDVENMILRRLHYNKDKGERGRELRGGQAPERTSFLTRLCHILRRYLPRIGLTLTLASTTRPF